MYEHRRRFLHIIHSCVEERVEGEVGACLQIASRGAAPRHSGVGNGSRSIVAGGLEWVEAYACGAVVGVESLCKSCVESLAQQPARVFSEL